MQTGDIIFVRGHNWISNAIKVFDKGQFSHVAIAVSSTHIFEAQGNTKTRIVKMNYKDYEIVRLPMTEKERQQVIAITNHMLNIDYDYMQIAGIVFNDLFGSSRKIFNNPRLLICSEAVDDILSQLNRKDFVSWNRDITPNELFEQLLKIPGAITADRGVGLNEVR
jgi:hypothetical protein